MTHDGRIERNKRITKALKESAERAAVDPAYAREELKAVGLTDDNDQWTPFGERVWHEMRTARPAERNRDE